MILNGLNMTTRADGYDYRYDEYEFPHVATDEARDLDELEILFTEDFADVPFTAAEEEMLPVDLTMSDRDRERTINILLGRHCYYL